MQEYVVIQIHARIPPKIAISVRSAPVHVQYVQEFNIKFNISISIKIRVTMRTSACKRTQKP
jgi:hypothetical protein